ncbi:UvrD-helicase domain-containing protein [uncultured Adlercreutzia sp.]|uniref:UvrD-helicase domain-containing protein n=1 Tax=uncultured Adlercreutzia sp. TaxID=875803 RepID=UPI0026F3D80A|nr:UvrD-helicase domain-containing protein [uncultured Adlercreutzia sp.]
MSLLDGCREGQLQTITTFDRPLMVSAGAGSGKTFTLTRRIAYALTEGAADSGVESIDQVLAITFTVKAAAELRDRIRALLREEGLVEESLKVDEAWVCTIGSMASRILREHALEVGVDPAFEMLEEGEAKFLRAEALERVLARQGEAGDPLVGAVIEEIGLRATGSYGKALVDHAQQVLGCVRSMPEGFDGLRVTLPKHRPADAARKLLEAAYSVLGVAEAWEELDKADGSFRDALCEGVENVQRWLEENPSSDYLDPLFDGEAFCDALFSLPPGSEKYRSKKPDADVFAAWRDAYAEAAFDVAAAMGSRIAVAAVRLARQIDEEYQLIKGPGRLDQSDLLSRCLAAFRAHPELSESYRRRFKLIMVDEFQDTDKLQVEVIRALAQPGFANVCTVGDAQQSIYRFRGADVNVFFDYRDQLTAGAVPPSFALLPDNFRSHGDVLALVDAIFSQPQVFGERFLHLDAQGAVNRQPDAIFDGGAYPRIHIEALHNDTTKETVSSDEAVERAARDIAEHFAALHSRGARPGEMALLLGSMKKAEVYQRALREAGLESLVSGGSGFGKSPEAALVAALLRVAKNRDDSEALYQVLASPLFALDDDVLLVLATKDALAQGESLDWPRQPLSAGFFAPDRDVVEAAFGLSDDEMRALSAARTMLGRFLARVPRCGASSSVRGLLAESGLLDRLQSRGVEGLAQAANYNKACVIVDELERGSLGAADLSRRYADYIALAKEAPGSLATLDADFVQIMTVHASKGLEFPHVAVAELKDGFSRGIMPAFMVENIGDETYLAAKYLPACAGKANADKCMKFDRPDDEVAGLPLLDGESAPRAYAAESAGRFMRRLLAYLVRQEREEARRLLYVALTRASKSLMLVLRYGKKCREGYGGSWITEDVHDALSWPLDASPSVTMVDFGGKAKARVVSERLLREDTAAEEVEALAESEKEEAEGEPAAAVDPEGECAPFLVPVRPLPPDTVFVPARRGREGVCSYSSLSGVHEHAGESVSDAAAGNVVGPGAAGADRESLPLGTSLGGEGSDIREAVPGEDATALGLAFHRLAQQAIERAAGGALFRPSEAAIEAQIQKEGLSDGQQVRLHVALDRWLASDEAARFAAHANLGAEVPFIVEFAPEPPAADGDALTESFYLEGEIDGLADNGDGAAFLIDYKTGGSPEESPEALDAKHRLQASCYAYALMRAGYTSVDAHFMRIEHVSATNPRDPQIVPYHFTTEDMPALEVLIRERHREATA